MRRSERFSDTRIMRVSRRGSERHKESIQLRRRCKKCLHGLSSRMTLALALSLTAMVLPAWLDCTPTADAAAFEPYELNGGLVTAVAGTNFCMIAADTRLIGQGGYQILSRNHVCSRLWPAQDDGDDCASRVHVRMREDIAGMMRSAGSSENLPSRVTAAEDRHKRQPVFRGDGLTTVRENPVWIASAGCVTDSETLKRVVQSELAAARYFGHSHSGNTRQVANTLSQTLYTRRGFPYYSFCVVAGIDGDGGAAYCYDAIGSYEQVAVATGGTGRELLQPVLDRLFSDDTTKRSNSPVGTTQAFRPDAEQTTRVGCSVEEAIDRLAIAYRSVSEREIGVGDSLVIIVTERSNPSVVDGPNSRDRPTVEPEWHCSYVVVPLKEH